MRQQIAAKQAVISVGLPQKATNQHLVAAHAAAVGWKYADIRHVEPEFTRSCRGVHHLPLNHIKPKIVQYLYGNAGGSRAGIDQQFHIL